MASGSSTSRRRSSRRWPSAGPRAWPSWSTPPGISRPTAHRLAVALEAHGLVGRDERGRFRLGVRLAAWGQGAVSLSTTMLERAAAVLAELRDETGESAQLYVRDGDFRVCVAAAERPAGLRDTVPVGARLPLVAGSGGKVLLAWADPDDLAGRRRRATRSARCASRAGPRPWPSARPGSRA